MGNWRTVNVEGKIDLFEGMKMMTLLKADWDREDGIIGVYL